MVILLLPANDLYLPVSVMVKLTYKWDVGEFSENQVTLHMRIKMKEGNILIYNFPLHHRLLVKVSLSKLLGYPLLFQKKKIDIFFKSELTQVICKLYF